jgi:hypothetical protein
MANRLIEVSINEVGAIMEMEVMAKSWFPKKTIESRAKQIFFIV